MDREIKAFSLQQAYQYLLLELEEAKEILPKNKQVINVEELGLEGNYDSVLNLLNGTGMCAGYCMEPPTVNPNQTTSQVLDTKNPPGDKKWETQYLAVFDSPFGDEVLPGTAKSATKKECVDKARIIVSETNRDAFVLIGKSPVGFSRCQAMVLYKPSTKQTTGTYLFVW